MHIRPWSTAKRATIIHHICADKDLVENNFSVFSTQKLKEVYRESKKLIKSPKILPL